MSGVITLGGERVSVVRLHVPNVGPWFVDCDLEEAPALSGRQLLSLGATSLSGTIDPRFDGTHGLRRKCRLVAGANGWSKAVKAKDYHNDAGVKARTVADDAAREVGEQLGTFAPGVDRVGPDYVRQSCAASVALEDAAGGAPWWTDYVGVTHVGPRAAKAAKADTYEVLGYDSRSRVVSLGLDDFSAVGIGSVLSVGLDAPQTVRELEVEISDKGIRARAWCGGVATERSGIAGLLTAIVERILARKLFGKYRYRVVKVAGSRLSLQAVRKGAGLPDMLPIAVWPGFASGEVNPREGSEVLVEFIEGDRAIPVVTNFATETGGAEVAYKGATVKVLTPPAVFQGTIVVGGVPSPAVGAVVWPSAYTLGTIEIGSPRMKVSKS